MNLKQWKILKKCANMENMNEIPTGLIVDSPWIPGYVNISTTDYFTIPEKWLGAQLKIRDDFPNLIRIPDFWVEFGMAAEPSGFGCKTMFYEYNTPTVMHLIHNADDIEQVITIPVPNPRTDGLMPLILNLYKNIMPKLADIGELIKIVAARGPFTIASHLMGLTELLIALKVYPEETKKLLRSTFAITKGWLEAQASVLPDVEGILVLDDVVGFLSEEDYLAFAYDIFKELFKSFSGNIILFHNDTDNPVCYKYIADLGIHIFNFTHKQPISKVKEMCGNQVCLMGNIPPLEVLAKGSPQDVLVSAHKCLEAFPDKKGIILSVGGGTSPGTSKDNIQALLNI